MKILFCGGGTAGHVNPALAIAQTIKRNMPYAEIAYVVTENGIENTLVPYKKYTIRIKGLKRSLSPANIGVIALAIKSIGMAKKIIKDFSPDIVIGTGGYACFPVIYAAHELGIKTAVHESNVIPGKALKILEKKVDKIFVNFEETSSYFSKKSKVIHTGNPLRYGFGTINVDNARKSLGINQKHVIVCYGGSLGANRINDGALQLIENLIKDCPEVFFIWSTGKREYEKIKDIMHQKGYDNLKNVTFSEYIYDMAEKIAAADIVICRAGAMSVSEMAISGKCTVFIPSPNVANNHQYKNAKLLADSDSAILICEEKIYALTDTVRELLIDDIKRESYAEKIKKYAVRDANKRIYKEIYEMISNQ